VFDFNLEAQLPDTGIAGPVDITSDGNFIIASASRNDSSWIFGFYRTSTNWVWRYRVGQSVAGGAGIQGVRLSGNDSLAIVNTYGGFYVFKTYTGQLMGQGLINPLSSSGTQFPQGISGNGNIIATINYFGYLRVFQWNGSLYNLLWQHQEPPGTFYNWMTAVDVSYDGTLIACGTLNFVTSSSFDGKIKLFKTTTGPTPLWTYTGAGDEVGSVALSKDGKILAAASYGDLNNSNNDLLVFKTTVTAPAPIFGVNSPGSFFWVSVSDNGSTVIASGKRVHARTFGNGGEVYNVYIDTADVPLGIGNNSIPVEFKLHQNFPNPFNPVTQINYNISADARVKIILFDAIGREVKTLVDKFQKGGGYSILLNAEDLSSGVYFYKISVTGNGTGAMFTDTKKLVLIK
jgi:WD40 repeat protein